MSVRVVQSVGSKQCSTFVKVKVWHLVIFTSAYKFNIQENTCRPGWEEEFTLVVRDLCCCCWSSKCWCCHANSWQVEEANAELELVVYNFEKGGHKFVGSVVVKLAELESGETSDEWYPLQLHPALREAAKGEMVPLLRVQMTLAAFRWDRLPPRPIDFVPDYRMPTRCGPGKEFLAAIILIRERKLKWILILAGRSACCATPGCPVQWGAFIKVCSVLQPILTPGRVAVRVRSAEVDSNRLNTDYKLRSFSFLEW